MPNPDGTRTRNEHRRELIHRMMDHVNNGVDPHEAFTRAAAEYQEKIQREGAEKMTAVRRYLGLMDH